MPVPVPACPDLDDRDERGLGGLIARAGEGRCALPLESVRVRAEIAGGLCRAVIEQRFRNTLSAPAAARPRRPGPSSSGPGTRGTAPPC